MKLNPKYIQAAGEAVIPVLGYFIWDWNLYFILLFYFIDVLAGEFFTHLKSKKIIESQGREIAERRWFYAGISAVLTIGLIALTHITMIVIHPDIDFLKEARAFWEYEEMGLQQGYLLFPLVVFASYQQYKMEFLLPGRDRTISMKQLWADHSRAYLIAIAGAVVALGLSFMLNLSEAVYVLSIVTGILVYRLFIQR